MKLKKAILEVLSRDELKKVCTDLDVADVDLRSVEAMATKLSRAHRATPEVLFEYLSELQVKDVAELMGAPSTGRKSALIESLLQLKDGYPGGTEELTLESEGVADAEPTVRGSPPGARTRRSPASGDSAESYLHTQEAIQRPDVGVQDQFQVRKPPRTYRYDSSLDPALSWDEQRERDLGEWLLGLIERAASAGEKTVFADAQEWKGGGVRVTSSADAVRVLKDISKPLLNWAGKAERHQISVPTVPLFVHERHSTKAILDGIRHRKAKGLSLDLFGDAGMDIRGQLEAYEHKGPWQNRMILGDSLSVMNSLLEFEGLGGQVQMIYIDPPYGVKFGSNFQPFVRRRDVKDGADSDLTREPEMVKAYRDTWELGLHSYLTYLRDRLLLAKDLLHGSGSVFVQISEENVHHVRELADEVFGAPNFCAQITFKKTSGAGSPSGGTDVLASVADYLLWYAKDVARVRYHALYAPKASAEGEGAYTWIETSRGIRRRMTAEEREDPTLWPDGSKVFRADNLTSQTGVEKTKYPIEVEGRTFRPEKGVWKTGEAGMARLLQRKRVILVGNTPSYVRYFSDFPVQTTNNLWEDTVIAGFAAPKLYVVQTSPKVVQRCVLMTTDPGDLVFDPTCGSGTTAYVAEQWGRRWITCDTSRVPLALARQRLLTATFPYYQLKEPKRGPAGGFVFQRKQNRKGEEIGGLVPHITLKSIANDEPPAMEVLVDRPEEISDVTRVAGPYVVEAMVAPVQPFEAIDASGRGLSDAATHIERMTEVLRQSKTLQLPGNRELTLAGIRRTVDAEYLHAEAKEGDKRIAVVFGPQDGAISATLVYEAAREAHFLKYDQIYFFGFAVEPNARGMIEDVKKLRIPAVYVAVTPDVAMSDLLKTTRGSEIFSITGLPDFKIRKATKKGSDKQPLYEVELAGLDIFDPETLETKSVDGASVPCWMIDSDYDGMSFYATQVFFPKTSAWDNLQKSLKATFDESVWEHLRGTISEPFAMGERKRVAVKVIDERGNELLRVRDVEV